MARKVKKEEEVNKRTVFVIQPPHYESKYVLLVTRAGGMMGTQTAAFGVDSVYTNTSPDGHSALSVRGVLINNDLVVEFPVGTTYLMVRRADMRMMTQLELLTEQRDEEKEIEEALAPMSKDAVPTEIPELTSGQYL